MGYPSIRFAASGRGVESGILSCYETIYWIAGGLPKQGGLDAIDPYLGRVRHAFLIGDAAPAFAAILAGRVETHRSGTLDTALRDAQRLALIEQGDDAVVLLSPACASFDQFENFEARGDAFREMVEGLPGKHLDPSEEPGIFPDTRRLEETAS